MAGGYDFRLSDKRLSCGRTTSCATSTPDFHLHNVYEMYFLIEGNITFFIEDRRCEMQAGDLVLLNNREVHKSVNPGGSPYTRYVLNFDPSLLSGFTALAGEGENLLLSCFRHDRNEAPVLRIPPQTVPEICEHFESIRQALAEKSTSGLIRAQAYLVLLLCRLNPLQESAPMQPRQRTLSTQVISYLQEHLSDPFSLDTLSMVFRVNKHHLCRCFKAETGGTIYHYLLLKRIAAAQTQLLNGKNVQEACDASGFSDYANFIRSFKKQTGISPGLYQKRFGR